MESGWTVSVEVIAEKLGRHRSTIFRELKRNTFVDKSVPDLNGYYCVTAHDMACQRRAKLRKLARFSSVRQSVIDRMMHGWSLQQIAGRRRHNSPFGMNPHLAALKSIGIQRQGKFFGRYLVRSDGHSRKSQDFLS